ncbi:two-component system sensor histidine kinase NtrB [Allorhodopirellula solitaria]|uniref:histidine kinase n=1 Tax=Allorhodopirellula solitaria TaxID=2527987 RepID=A0A5C5YG77_9BACT|nr:ATP-binding protein [Allorhodopirellula solitaria]TWT73883.1 Sensor protein ZraS [Allorhodopirellula solitaria]
MIDAPGGRGVRRLAIGLTVLSCLSFLTTAWIFSVVRREQEIVSQIVKHLPASDLVVASELKGELMLQRSLLLLLVIDFAAAGVALVFVVRAYLSSEQSLEDVKVLSSDILASMDAGVITTDTEGILTSINPQGRMLIGLSGNPQPPLPPGIGHNVSDLGLEHESLAEILEESRRFENPIRDRDYRVLRSGHTQTLRAGCTRLHNRSGDELGFVLQVRDVTQKSLMEDRLRRMERYMGLGSLAAGLQHEIKNPLAALALHIQLLSERLAEETDDAEINESLSILNAEVKRIGNVLDGFRNYASINDIGRSPVDVSELIEKLVRLLRPHAEKQNVRLLVSGPEQPLDTIEADSARLEQVFLNLALNAIAAMPAGGSLRFAVSGEDGGIRIDVTDSGNGIPAEVQPKIFDPYFTTRSDGTGMGLALCDKIIRQHNGSLDFETGPNGTTFTVQLH